MSRVFMKKYAVFCDVKEHMSGYHQFIIPVNWECWIEKTL